METVYLLFGSNIDDPERQLKEAVTRLSPIGQIISKSSFFKTKAWGKTNQPDFMNQAVVIETSLSPLTLLREIQRIEFSMGRLRAEKWEPRLIDIDILLFGDEIVNEKDLIIPHPLLPERRFALTPLNEVAPLLIHPIHKKNIQTLLIECKDGLEVEEVN